MKVFPNILTGIEDCLKSVFLSDKYTADVLEKAFKQNRKWGSRDRKLIAEAVFGIVRWKRLYEYAADASVNDSDYFRKLIAVFLTTQNLAVPSDYSGADTAKIINTCKKENLPSGIKASFPEWLNEKGRQELGENWEKEMFALNEPATVFLRVNTIKTDTTTLQQRLSGSGIKTRIHTSLEDCLILEKRQNLANLQDFKDGLFEIQDAGSQLIAPFLELNTGMKVVDACAGAGGKSLHAAAILKNSGRIISLDIEEKKLSVLKERAKRAGVKNIDAQLITPGTIRNYKNFADRLLLDVPCSGTGVIKRHPDTKWKLSLAEIENLVGVQQKIMLEYEQMLKPGGLLIYATCSIFPSENTKQVQNFLKNKPEYKLLKEQTVLPSEGSDGFYMARLKKMG